MDIFLEIASLLVGAYAAQLLHRRFQQLGDVILDLLPNARFLQRGQQIWSLNVGEPAAQRALYNVIVHHGHPRYSENRQKTVPLRTLVFAYPLEAGSGFGTVTSVAGVVIGITEGSGEISGQQREEVMAHSLGRFERGGFAGLSSV
jgi:hypothetical protein